MFSSIESNQSTTHTSVCATQITAQPSVDSPDSQDGLSNDRLSRDPDWYPEADAGGEQLIDEIGRAGMVDVCAAVDQMCTTPIMSEIAMIQNVAVHPAQVAAPIVRRQLMSMSPMPVDRAVAHAPVARVPVATKTGAVNNKRARSTKSNIERGLAKSIFAWKNGDSTDGLYCLPFNTGLSAIDRSMAPTAAAMKTLRIVSGMFGLNLGDLIEFFSLEAITTCSWTSEDGVSCPMPAGCATFTCGHHYNRTREVGAEYMDCINASIAAGIEFMTVAEAERAEAERAEA